MRHLLVVLFAMLSLLITTDKAIATDEQGITILVLGDSLSAAYGIQRDQGWVNLMRSELEKEASVVNASISGETTGGGLAALPEHLARYQPDILVLELGANDGLRGFPIPVIQRNLEEMIELAQQAGAKVLLVGIHILPNYGKRYTDAFYEVYETLAQDFDLNFVPFLLENVALRAELMQKDQLHPTAEAQPIILSNVMPELRALLRTITEN